MADEARKYGIWGVSYRAAWHLKHKMMEAMMQREESRQLNGFVQIDDAYLGGERNGGKPGRGSENKQALVTAAASSTPMHCKAIKACLRRHRQCTGQLHETKC